MTTRRVQKDDAFSALSSSSASAQLMTVEVVGPDRATLTVAGEVDASNADQLRLAILDAASQHHGELAVDLAGITFMDSSGIWAIADASVALDPSVSELVLCNVPARVRRILEITQSELALTVRE